MMQILSKKILRFKYLHRTCSHFDTLLDFPSHIHTKQNGTFVNTRRINEVFLFRFSFSHKKTKNWSRRRTTFNGTSDMFNRIRRRITICNIIHTQFAYKVTKRHSTQSNDEIESASNTCYLKNGDRRKMESTALKIRNWYSEKFFWIFCFSLSEWQSGSSICGFWSDFILNFFSWFFFSLSTRGPYDVGQRRNISIEFLLCLRRNHLFKLMHIHWTYGVCVLEYEQLLVMLLLLKHEWMRKENEYENEESAKKKKYVDHKIVGLKEERKKIE